METPGGAFAHKCFTSTCISCFLSDRELFWGSFFNLQNLCASLLFAVTDKPCIFEIVLSKESYRKSYQNNIIKKLPEQIHFSESPTHVPMCHFACVMIDVLLFSAWAFNANLKLCEFGVLSCGCFRFGFVPLLFFFFLLSYCYV